MKMEAAVLRGQPIVTVCVLQPVVRVCVPQPVVMGCLSLL